MSIQAISNQPTAVTIKGASAPAAIQSASSAQPGNNVTTSPSNGTKSTSSPSSDKVNISSAAHAALKAALAEATETSVQTAQEARHGDIQAQRLLAREQAEKSG